MFRIDLRRWGFKLRIIDGYLFISEEREEIGLNFNSDKGDGNGSL